MITKLLTYCFARALSSCCFAGSGLHASHDDIESENGGVIRSRLCRGEQDYEEWRMGASGGCWMTDFKLRKKIFSFCEMY